MRLVIVGALTPLGAEVRRRLAAAGLPDHEALLADFDPVDEEGARRISEYAGAAQLVADAAEVDFRPADVVVLCGDPGRSASLLDRAQAARACVDLSGASRRRAGVPWVHFRVHDEASFPVRGLIGAPQPASATLAALLAPLARAGLARAAAATVLLPASAVGEGAVEELYQQTLALLNFTDPPRQALAHQLTFNLLPWEDPSRPQGAGLADDLTWEVGRLLGDGGPPVDLQLLLAPTFHAYGFSVRLEAPAGTSAGEILAAVAAAGVQVGGPGKALPSPVTAPEEGILIAPPRPGGKGIFWLWAVSDSLGDGAAENARRLAGCLAAASVG